MSVEDLIDAVYHNNREEVLRLIDEEDVDVNVDQVSFFFSLSLLMILVLIEQIGTTPFIEASKYGNLNMMQLLLEKGANPIIKDRVSSFLSFFLSFLSFCCYKQYDVYDVHVVLLCEQLNWNALHCASLKDHLHIVQFLASLELNPFEMTSVSLKQQSYGLQLYDSDCVCEQDEETARDWAIEEDEEETASFLQQYEGFSHHTFFFILSFLNS